MVMAAIAQEGSTEEVANPKPNKKRFMGRFRKSKKTEHKSEQVSEQKSSKRDETPSPVPTDSSYDAHFSRDGVPIVTSKGNFRASDVRPSQKDKAKNKGHRGRNMFHKRASAKESAFAGPPRYDWIDIETAAAIKVQSAYRRNKVLWELERQGKSTAKMRNRIRKRQAKQRSVAVAEDTPGLFQCCGVGLVFGDATEEDQAVVKQFERHQYEEKRKEREQKEKALRKYHPREKPSTKMVEGVEVVESFDE